MDVCSRALLAVTLVATVDAQIPDYAGGSHVCDSDSIPFASKVSCENFCDKSVESYGDTINTQNIDEGQTVSAFYMGGFF